MKVIIGSARINEKGGVSGGKAGDQKQKNTPDYSGEVSLEEFYIHKLGWIIARAKNPAHAYALARCMYTACNNANVGYDQGTNRLGIIKHGTKADVPTGSDCGSLVRECVIEATGVDCGNFNTGTELNALLNSGLFEKVAFTSKEELHEGDILITKTKGHTAIVVNAYISSNGVSVENSTNAFYRVYTSKWLDEVKNLTDYAGIENKAISGVMVRVPGHTIKTRVGVLNGKYLGWVDGYNEADEENGYAGILGSSIDRLQINYPDGVAMYRVSLVGKKAYLPWVANTSDYAGIKGCAIDKVQVYIK